MSFLLIQCNSGNLKKKKKENLLESWDILICHEGVTESAIFFCWQLTSALPTLARMAFVIYQMRIRVSHAGMWDTIFRSVFLCVRMASHILFSSSPVVSEFFVCSYTAAQYAHNYHHSVCVVGMLAALALQPALSFIFTEHQARLNPVICIIVGLLLFIP